MLKRFGVGLVMIGVVMIEVLFCSALWAAEEAALPFPKGEQFIFDVFCSDMKLGESTLIFRGIEEMDGVDYYHITFDTDVCGFRDREEIYAYKDTFLPYKIIRNITRMESFPAVITESYDQEAYKVHIKNRGSLLTRNSTIKKKAPLHNAILLMYYFRSKETYIKDEKVNVVLPSAKFDIALTGEEKISTGLGEREAFIFEGNPSKFTFWLSADDKKAPLKIKGHGMLNYVFLLKSIDNRGKE